MYLGNIQLSSMAKIDQWEEKAGLYSEYIEQDWTPTYSATEVIDPKDIIDLTSKMNSEGILKWDVPDGKWMVLRFCHVPTGGRIKHSRFNMEGLECDKLSPIAAKVQWDNYFRFSTV